MSKVFGFDSFSRDIARECFPKACQFLRVLIAPELIALVNLSRRFDRVSPLNRAWGTY